MDEMHRNADGERESINNKLFETALEDAKSRVTGVSDAALRVAADSVNRQVAGINLVQTKTSSEASEKSYPWSISQNQAVRRAHRLHSVSGSPAHLLAS